MSSKIRWRESFQKARSQSQGSLESQTKKSSLLEEGDLSVSDDELEEYLGTLKKKSGVGRLWRGNTFDKVIDRTPDVSISSVSDGEGPSELQDKSMNDNDNDFRPNILTISHSEDEKTAISEPSSIKPMEAVHMMSDLEHSEGYLDLVNNVKLTISDKVELDGMEDRYVGKDLSECEEPHTLDEVVEEIEEDMQSKHFESASSIVSLALSDPHETHHKKSERSEHSSHHSSHRQRSSNHSSHRQRSSNHSSHRQRSSNHSSHRHHRNISDHSSSQPNRRKSSYKETSSKKSDYSYKDDFSDSENTSIVQESSHHSISFTSSATSASMKSQRSTKRVTKKQLKNHQSYHDASTQVNPEDILTEQRLGIGMATLGPSFGHQYVDPSPIACHAVSADALEALTAYNPAVVALTDMLRQQLRLVEQFIDNSRRMYQSYSSNLNTNYNYTTLEDTMKYIQENKPFHRKQQLDIKATKQQSDKNG